MRNVGSEVVWNSQANGKVTQKVGTVIRVVGAGVSPPQEVYRLSHRIKYDGNTTRNHESYLVSVAAPGKGKPSLYWPVASSLRTHYPMEAETA